MLQELQVKMAVLLHRIRIIVVPRDQFISRFTRTTRLCVFPYSAIPSGFPLDLSSSTTRLVLRSPSLYLIFKIWLVVLAQAADKFPAWNSSWLHSMAIGFILPPAQLRALPLRIHPSSHRLPRSFPQRLHPNRQRKTVPLDRSTPAWPTQMGRYAQKIRRVPLLVPDFMVQGLQFDLLRNEVYGEWEEFVHPSGATYYYNRTRNAYTGLNIRDCSSDRLDKFEAWVKTTQNRIQGDLTLVAEPVRTQNVDGDVYLYYLVALDAHIIGWMEPLDGTYLFRECDSARHWNHKRLELEAQFWKHVEFFPRDFKLDRILLRQLRSELDWFHADALTLEGSTSATIFSNKETMEKIITRLASLDNLSESDGSIPETGVALFGRLYHMLPAMFCLPVLVRERLKQIHVDGLVNYLDLKTFIDEFNSQNNAQIALAGVIMAIDAGFLAVQGVGTGVFFDK
ncbi:hypothetical protein P692DRAFT_20878031 [Suillus brevipes Sb2]|nr:hypothetical protein P692DRAFT_20878031 [Suillus brevipes Sb2]